MFTRLLKHQLKSTWKEFNIAYGIMILSAIIFSFVFKTENVVLISILSSIFAFSIIGVMGLIFYYSIKLFTSMYGKEAYLNFTLPVSTHSMVISKIIAVICYTLGYSIAGIISVFMLFVCLGPDYLESFLQFFDIALESISTVNPWIIIITSIYSFLSFIALLVSFHFILAVANTSTSVKRKNWLTFLLIFGLSIALDIVSTLDPIGLHLCFNENYEIFLIHTSSIIESDTLIIDFSGYLFSIWDSILVLGQIFGLYFATIYIINHKVEIQ